MNNRLSIIFMLILTASSGLYAENISLNALIQKAKDKNPEIIAARNNWNAEKVRVLPERTWESPGFFIDSQNMPVDEFNLGKANETMYGIEQMVPFPGKRFCTNSKRASSLILDLAFCISRIAA